jgi:hypothetical protein
MLRASTVIWIIMFDKKAQGLFILRPTRDLIILPHSATALSGAVSFPEVKKTGLARTNASNFFGSR